MCLKAPISDRINLYACCELFLHFLLVFLFKIYFKNFKFKFKNLKCILGNMKETEGTGVHSGMN